MGKYFVALVIFVLPTLLLYLLAHIGWGGTDAGANIIAGVFFGGLFASSYLLKRK